MRLTHTVMSQVFFLSALDSPCLQVVITRGAKASGWSPREVESWGLGMMAKGKKRQDDFTSSKFGQECWAYCVRGIFLSLTLSPLFFSYCGSCLFLNSPLSGFTELPVMWCFCLPDGDSQWWNSTGMDLSLVCLLY